MFKRHSLCIGHTYLHGGWICWYHIKTRQVDDLSIASYTKILTIAKMIAMLIIFGSFIFRCDIQKKKIEINFFTSDLRIFCILEKSVGKLSLG